MAKSTLLHPQQFFHTLVPGFHSHLRIPSDFFSKYIEGRSVDNTAQLKSDSSDITWQVKMAGRKLSDGWRVFAVAHNLQAGHRILVRYEGDMVFHVSNCGEIPRNNNNDDVDDKHSHPRTDVDDLPNKKRRKTNSNEAEAEADSSSLVNSCFVATVTAFNLLTDTLYLPQHYTRSNGLRRESHKIVLINGEGRSWTLDLGFNESSDTFCMTRGWRSFCEENGQEAGGFFTFKLVGNGETLVLFFCHTEPISSKRQRDSSTSSSQNRLVTIKIRPDILTSKRMRLPQQFVMESNMNKPGLIYLLGKDDTKWTTNLVKERDGRMNLGSGWTVFAKANGFKPGESVTLESIWEDGTPMIRFLRAESNSSKANKKEWVSTEVTEPRTSDSSSEIYDRFVTLPLLPEDVKAGVLMLPSQFLKANGINKLEKITILAENKMELSGCLLSRGGTVVLEDGWDQFCEANGVKLGESFTLEFIKKPEKTTHVFKFCSPETNK